MWSLVPIIVFAMVLAWLSDIRSVYSIGPFGDREYIRRDILFYSIMVLGMAVFVGLRTRGNDTYTYIQMYEGFDRGISGLSKIDWFSPASAPGYQAVSVIIKSAGGTSQDYLMLFALVTVLIYLWFIRKYSRNVVFSLFLFITLEVYTFCMAAIKQSIAVAILLIATDRAIQKKYISFIIFVLAAMLFHPYAFVYLIVPLLFFRPWSIFTWVLLAGTGVVSVSLNRLLGNILSMTDLLGADYTINEFIGEGVSVFRLMVVWVPVLLSFIAKKYIRDFSDREMNLFINLSMINAMIMFIGLFGTANYFARLANYFLIFQTLSLPWLLCIFEKRSRYFITGIAVVSYSFYFFYACVLANGAFDDVYSFITLSQYFGQ